MSSANCCLNRRPSSPDCPPSRPILRRHFGHRASVVEPTLPCTSTTSRLSKPEDIAALQAIFESERSSTESERRRVKNKDSSNTLNTVKQKLKKHLSRDSEGSKRLSRSSVGTSEEEIERRAELRRIRQKRIRDELSIEGVYDDDARSLPSIQATLSASSLLIDNLTQRPPSLPPMSSPSREPPYIVLPQLQVPNTELPLEHINSSVEKGSQLESRFYGLASWNTPSRSPKSHSEPDLSDWNRTFFATAERRYSTPSPANPPKLDITHQRRSVDIAPPYPIPSGSTLKPPWLHKTKRSTSSWRSSFGVQNRGDHLRKLSQGASVPPPPQVIGCKANFGLKPTDMWLTGQGLWSPQVVLTSGEDAATDLSAAHKKSHSVDTDFGGVDGSFECVETVHLHQMEISRRLASHGLNSSGSSPHLSKDGYSHQRGISTKSGYPRRAHQDRETKESIAGSSSFVPEPWNLAIEDETSSLYPSGGNSIQPSPRNSLDLLSVFLENSQKVDSFKAVPFEAVSMIIPDFTQMNPAPKTFPNKVSTVCLALPTLPPMQPRRRSTFDDSSIAVSETDSYRQREIELGTVKTRFPESEMRNGIPAPRNSKFKEEFSLKHPKPEHLAKGRKSAISMLGKIAIWTYDGQIDKTLVASVPQIALASLEERKTPSQTSETGGSLSPRNGRQTTQPRGKSVNPNIRAETMETLASPGSGAEQTSRVGFKPLTWGKMDDTRELSKTDRIIARKDEDMGDWERAMDRSEQKAKFRSKKIDQFSRASDDKRYPASWSRFSSFDRAQRTTSAQENDGVDQKDFAIKSKEDGKIVWFHSQRAVRLVQEDEDDQIAMLDAQKKKNFLRVLGNTLKEKLSKTDVELYESVYDQARGRRGSLNLAGKVEYPELELLPMEIMSDAELEQQVEEELENDDVEKQENELEAIFNKPIKNSESKLGPVAPQLAPKAFQKKHLHLKELDSPREVAHAMEGYFERIPGKRAEHLKRAITIDTRAFDEQVVAVITLKEKMDAASKRGGRRGPVARKKPEVPNTFKESPRPFHPITQDGASDYTDTDYNLTRNDDSISTMLGALELSIADPKFYADCILSQLVADGVDQEEDLEFSPQPSKDKYKTWGGKDRMRCNYSNMLKSPRRMASYGDMLLRKSTDEFQYELEKMEKLERENALAAAERAWGDVY